MSYDEVLKNVHVLFLNNENEEWNYPKVLRSQRFWWLQKHSCQMKSQSFEMRFLTQIQNIHLPVSLKYSVLTAEISENLKRNSWIKIGCQFTATFLFQSIESKKLLIFFGFLSIIHYLISTFCNCQVFFIPLNDITSRKLA